MYASWLTMIMYIYKLSNQEFRVKPLGYEVNIDETKDVIEALINEPINPKATYFGTYKETKARIELEIKLPQVVNKGKRRIAKMQTKVPLMLTKGKGEDEEEESKEEEVPLKKKGEATITKPKPAMFVRRTSRKKSNKREEKIVFKKPPPTLQ